MLIVVVSGGVFVVRAERADIVSCLFDNLKFWVEGQNGVMGRHLHHASVGLWPLLWSGQRPTF